MVLSGLSWFDRYPSHSHMALAGSEGPRNSPFFNYFFVGLSVLMYYLWRAPWLESGTWAGGDGTL